MAQRTVILGWESEVLIGGASAFPMGTSQSSVAIASGSAGPFTTQALGITAGTPVLLISAAGTMWGVAASSMTTGTSLTVTVASGNITGTGTGTSWWICPYGLGSPFGVKGGRLDISIDAEECGDSQTAAAKAFKLGRYGMKGSVEFYAKSDVQAFGGTPFLLGQGGPSSSLQGEISLTVFPNGNTLATKAPFIIPSFIVDAGPLSWNMDGKLEGSLSGNANGPFQMSA